MLDFGLALQAMKVGDRVARRGWNGKGMYVFMIFNWTSGHTQLPHLPFLAMKTADDKVVPWLANQTDMLAVDWELL